MTYHDPLKRLSATAAVATIVATGAAGSAAAQSFDLEDTEVVLPESGLKASFTEGRCDLDGDRLHLGGLAFAALS